MNKIGVQSDGKEICKNRKTRKMNDKAITALAREYAEDIRKDILPFFPRPLPDSMEVLIKADQEKAEQVIRFLLRQYCLIEKKAQTNSRSHENPWCENEL